MITDESSRLESLQKYRILDTDPEQRFDDLTMIASQICCTRIALISLIDENRQWFKSRVGVQVKETARSISFCAHAIQHEGLFMVPDALQDDRFRENPLVTGEPHVRFYAGMPLLSREGAALGTLCVLDHQPHTLTKSQTDALAALKRQVESQLELRRNLAELRVALDHIESLSALIPFCSNCEFNVVIPADPAAMHTVTAGVNELLTKKGWDSQEITKVELAITEALANAIKHGCKNDLSKQIQCSVTFDANGELVIAVRDPGPGFDVNAVPDPLEGKNLLKTSGRGVFLINQLMDTVEFTEEGRQITMRKRTEASADTD